MPSVQNCVWALCSTLTWLPFDRLVLLETIDASLCRYKELPTQTFARANISSLCIAMNGSLSSLWLMLILVVSVSCGRTITSKSWSTMLLLERKHSEADSIRSLLLKEQKSVPARKSSNVKQGGCGRSLKAQNLLLNLVSRLENKDSEGGGPLKRDYYSLKRTGLKRSRSYLKRPTCWSTDKYLTSPRLIFLFSMSAVISMRSSTSISCFLTISFCWLMSFFSPLPICISIADRSVFSRSMAPLMLTWALSRKSRYQ